MSLQTNQTSDNRPPASASTETKPAQEVGKARKRTRQEKRGGFGPMDPNKPRARGAHKLKVNADDVELITKKRPKPKKRSTPQRQKGERHMELLQNTYNFEVLHTRTNGAPQFRYAIKPNTLRPIVGAAPANLGQDAMVRLQQIFVGRNRPFSTADKRGSNSNAQPMYTYLRKLMLGTIVLDVCNTSSLPDIHLSVFGSNEIIQTLQAYVHTCRSETNLYIHHYSRSPVTFARDHTSYTFHQITGRDELLVDGQNFKQATPIVIGSDLTVIGSDSYTLMTKLARGTIVYNLGFRSVVGSGRIGAPVSEAVFSGFSLAGTSEDEPPLRGVRLVQAGKSVEHIMEASSYFSQAGRHLFSLKISDAEGSLLYGATMFLIDVITLWPMVAIDADGVLQHVPQVDAHYTPRVERHEPPTPSVNLEETAKQVLPTFDTPTQRIADKQPARPTGKLSREDFLKSLEDASGEGLAIALMSMYFRVLSKEAGMRTQKLGGMLLSHTRDGTISLSHLRAMVRSKDEFMSYMHYLSHIYDVERTKSPMDFAPLELPKGSAFASPHPDHSSTAPVTSEGEEVVERSAGEAVPAEPVSGGAEVGETEASAQAGEQAPPDPSQGTGRDEDLPPPDSAPESANEAGSPPPSPPEPVEEEPAPRTAKTREIPFSPEAAPISDSRVGNEEPVAIRVFHPAPEPPPNPGPIQIPNHMTHVVAPGEAALNLPEPQVVIQPDGSRWLPARMVQFFHNLGARFPNMEAVVEGVPSSEETWRWVTGGGATPAVDRAIRWATVGGMAMLGASVVAKATVQEVRKFVPIITQAVGSLFRPKALLTVARILKFVGFAAIRAAVLGCVAGTVRQRAYDAAWEITAPVHDLPEAIDQQLRTTLLARYTGADQPNEIDLAHWCANFGRGVPANVYPNMQDGDRYVGRARQIWRQFRQENTPRFMLIQESQFFKGAIYGAMAGLALTALELIASTAATVTPSLGAVLPVGSPSLIKSAIYTTAWYNTLMKDPDANYQVLAIIENAWLWGETPILEELLKSSMGRWVPWDWNKITPSTLFGIYEFTARLYTSYRLAQSDPCLAAGLTFMALPPLAMHNFIGEWNMPTRMLAHSAYNVFALYAFEGLQKYCQVVAEIKAEAEAAGAGASTPAMLLFLAATAMVVTMLTYNSNPPVVGSSLPINGPTRVRPGAICTQMLPNAPVRPGAQLIVQPIDPECKPSPPYTRVGPFSQQYHVFKFNSCGHCVVRAMCHRMGGLPAGIKTQMDQTRDQWQEWERVTGEIDANVTRDFPTTHDLILANFQDQWVPLIDQEQWVKRFPSAKAADMLKEWLYTMDIPSSYDCFVKSEKSVMHIDDFDRLEFTGPFKHIVLIGMVHGAPLFIKLDPRGISVPHAALRVQGGPWCNFLNKSLSAGFHTQIFYNPGHTPLELSQWFEAACFGVQLGAFPFAIAVQGDDVLMIHAPRGAVEFLSIDLSRYDMTQRPSHFAQTWNLIARMGLNRGLDDATLDTFMEQQGLFGDTKRYNSRYAKLRVVGTMASGDGVTITFNSLTILQASVLVMRSGRNDIVATLQQYGFTPTYTTATILRPLEVDFLQSRPWLTERGLRVFAPKPGRILARFFYSDRPFNREWKRRLFSYRLAQGLLATASHVPIINDLCQRVMEVTASSVTDKSYKPAYDSEICEELRMWRVGSNEKESPATLAEMAELYGLSIGDLVFFRKKVSEWEWMQPVDDDARSSFIVKSICSIDLA